MNSDVEKQLINDVREIKEALLGNQYNKKGYVARIEALEAHKKKLDNRVLFLTGFFAAITWAIKTVFKL